MYVLFNINEDISCGVSEKVLPFTNGLYVTNVEQLKKSFIQTITIPRKNARGEQLYLNKDGAITTNKTNTIATTTTETTVEVDILHKPKIFNKIDVMKFKQSQMLNEYNMDKCMLYEFGLEKFINNKTSEKCILGQNEIVITPSGICKTNAIDITNSDNVIICVDASEPVNVFYSFDGDGFLKYKKNIKSSSNQLYLCFKNPTNNNVKIYAYQVLYNIKDVNK